MSIELVEGDTVHLAWKKGAELLLTKREVFHLVTTINDPTRLEKNWFEILDPSEYSKKNISGLSDVANTIFPYKYLDRPYSRECIYKKYIKAHDRKMRWRGSNRSWGTYFDRMIRFGTKDINQLEQAITSLIKWSNRNWKACLVIHTSSADTDPIKKTIGNPCLQYLQLLCPDKHTLSMLCVYRNHDFFAKALGNFIGLGQLLKFICNETDRVPGQLICHSAHASYMEISKRDFKKYAAL